mgnify:CR=1 FL=1
MTNSSDINYLLQLKKILIEEIRVLENSNSNQSYLQSLPIRDIDVKKIVDKYDSTNNRIDLEHSIVVKRNLLEEVNIELKKNCRHRIIEGEFNISYSENKNVQYCVLCMNLF